MKKPRRCRALRTFALGSKDGCCRMTDSTLHQFSVLSSSLLVAVALANIESVRKSVGLSVELALAVPIGVADRVAK